MTGPERQRRSALLLRLSWRDLGSHWIAVVAIALVMAIGAGVYAGLGSTATWRRQSNDVSFAQVNMHDLRAALSPGTFVEAGSLATLVAGLDGSGEVIEVQERLVVDSQVEVTVDGEERLFAARLVGVDLDAAVVIDDVWVRDGQRPATVSDPVTAVLEAKFADYHSLAPSGTVTVAGGGQVDYVGLGVAPEDFIVIGAPGTVLAEANLAVVYLPLAAAQELTGRVGQVNDVVLLVADGERDRVEAGLERAIDETDGVSAVVTNQDEAEAFRLLYDDIENDQRIWNAISALVLFAAALAAFNLVSRVVEAQRREIGIGMAMGVSRWRLAARPLLLGAQIAVIGTVAAVGVGLLVGAAMEDLLRSFLPLPEYRTPFQLGVFGQAAVLTLAVPVVASAIPVIRAVRVEPIVAIRTGHLAARSGRLTDWTSRIPLPGRSLTLMPVRNVLRSPRRSLLTAGGIGAAITALVAILGMLDSFSRTIDIGADEVTKGDPDRLIVLLDDFHRSSSPVVDEVVALASVGRVDAGLRLPVTGLASEDGEDLDLVLELVDMESAAWTPTIAERGAGDPASGLVLAEKAAADLGVDVGDTVRIRHPRRAGAGFGIGESAIVVSALHPNPLRVNAFADLMLAEQFGFDGTSNYLHVYPAEGRSVNEVQADLFSVPGVASSEAAAAVSEAFDEALEQFVGFLFVTGGAVLVLAMLIAFNSTRISVEERRREHATMRAFGLPVRKVVGVVARESILVGLGATVIGIVGGRLFLVWMLRSLASRTLPDIGMELHVSATTLVAAILVGIVAVAAVPLLLAGRIRRMDIPDTLRVME